MAYVAYSKIVYPIYFDTTIPWNSLVLQKNALSKHIYEIGWCSKVGFYWYCIWVSIKIPLKRIYIQKYFSLNIQGNLALNWNVLWLSYSCENSLTYLRELSSGRYSSLRSMTLGALKSALRWSQATGELATWNTFLCSSLVSLLKLSFGMMPSLNKQGECEYILWMCSS